MVTFSKLHYYVAKNIDLIPNNISQQVLSKTMEILYIDPGTGSLLISALIGIGFTLIYTLKGLFYKITHLFLGKRDRNLSDFSGEIVFFSEGRGYWRVYRPVIEGLIRQGQKLFTCLPTRKMKGSHIIPIF